MNRFEEHIINFKLVTIFVTLQIAFIKCQQVGFNDQLYSSRTNIQHYNYDSNTNNNNAQIATTIGNFQYSNDDLDHKFIIDVKRNKDGKLEPLVRKTSPSSSYSSTSSSISSVSDDINTRIDKPKKPGGIIYFPTSDYNLMLQNPENSILLQRYQLLQQQQKQQYQQQTDPQTTASSTLVPKCNSIGIGNSFCTQVDNYPIEAVIKAIQRDSSKFEAAFGEDLLPEPQTEISQRIDPDFGEEALCSSRERLIFPQAGMTKENTWSFIINHENYTQGIRVEECTNPGSTCLMAENFPTGYKTECKQKFIYRQLLSMNEQGVVLKELFHIPSCCKCYIKTFN